MVRGILETHSEGILGRVVGDFLEEPLDKFSINFQVSLEETLRRISEEALQRILEKISGGIIGRSFEDNFEEFSVSVI